MCCRYILYTRLRELRAARKFCFLSPSSSGLLVVVSCFGPGTWNKKKPRTGAGAGTRDQDQGPGSHCACVPVSSFLCLGSVLCCQWLPGPWSWSLVPAPAPVLGPKIQERRHWNTRTKWACSRDRHGHRLHRPHTKSHTKALPPLTATLQVPCHA
jgi:hypothetical protein